MDNKNGCLCSANENIVIACSGACDLGQVSDTVARKLRDSGKLKMNCLAAVGAGIESTIEIFKKNSILLIDGCSVNCGKKILDKAGITEYAYIRITDLGFAKGKTLVTDSVINTVYDKAVKIF